MRAPHAEPALVVAATASAATASLPPATLLAEPPAGVDWAPPCYARWLAAGAGLVAVAPLAVADRDRLERARVPVLAADAAAQPGALERARAAYWPALPELRRLGLGLGSPAPGLVVVGERAHRDEEPWWAPRGCLPLLLEALRLLGWDELAVYGANAKRPDGARRGEDLAALHALLARYEPAWVALHDDAAACLRGAGVPHVYAPHPAHARRFRHGRGAAGYAAELERRGVPRGPWHGRALTCYADAAAARALCAALGVDPEAGRAPGPRRGTHGRGVSEAVRLRARAAYVTGSDAAWLDERGRPRPVRNIADAAAAAGVAPDSLRGYAVAEDWPGARQAHLEEAYQRSLATAADRDARTLGRCRDLAGRALTTYLRRLCDRIEGGEKEEPLVPTPAGAEALGRLALALAGRGDPETQAEVERLRRLSTEELYAALQAHDDAVFGPGGG